jgi:predicted RNA-binding Zn ribbon-like protein
MTIKNSRVDQNAADQKFADGLTQNAAQIGPIVVGGKQLQPADLATVLLARIAARKAADQARTNQQVAVAAEKAEVASTRALVRAAKQVLRASFSHLPNLLATLGIATVAHPATATEKAAAAVKAKATKAAGGAKAKKEKQASAPAAAPSPAPATKPQA